MENLTLQDVRVLLNVSPTQLVSAQDAQGRTALHWVVLNKRFDVADALVAYGANPLAKDKHGKTPMDYADCRVLEEREWRLRTSVIAFYWKSYVQQIEGPGQPFAIHPSQYVRIFDQERRKILADVQRA